MLSDGKNTNIIFILSYFMPKLLPLHEIYNDFKDMLLEKIEALLQEVDGLKASNQEEIEALRLKYLSKKGEISALMNDFRNVAADQKKTVGIKINELKLVRPF